MWAADTMSEVFYTRFEDNAGFQAADMPRYETLGIQYVVVQARNRVAGAAAFENAGYCVYQLK